jgi:hypothetical protein
MNDPLWGDKPPQSGREFAGRLWEVGREAAAKKKHVVEAVGAVRLDKTRVQLRSLFEEELDRQGVPRDPIWVEQKLDELEWSPAERGLETVRRLGLAAVTLGRMAQSRGMPDAPQWMEPPDDATYYAWARRTEKTPVDIDPDADAWLERALGSTPRRVGTLMAVLDVWFSYESAPSDGGLVVVHLGGQRVGTLNRAASERFATVMEAAASRGAKPRASAPLAKAVHLRPPYLLVVDVPLPDAPS